MRTTAASRRFTGDDLPDEILYAIVDNARFAPSGGNRQGIRVIAVRDPETRQTLADLTAPTAQRFAAQLAAGENPFDPITPSRLADHDADAKPAPAHLLTPLLDAAVVLVICVDLHTVAATDQSLSRVGIVGGASVYPFAWNVLLAARSEGYGGTITTMSVAAEPELKSLLGIPEQYAVAALLPLGKPAKQPSRLTRRAVEEIVTLGHWEGPPLHPAR